MRILLGILLFIPGLLTAQNFSIEGTVIDAVTKEGIGNAFVFISQSYHSTRTDSVGKYSLNNIKDKTFEVVVGVKGYETIVYQSTPASPKTTIKFELLKSDTAKVANDPEGWAKWGRYVTGNLFGPSKNADECELLNPEVLRFRFNDSTQELIVTADDLLMIINDGLGYMISFQLESFVSKVHAGNYSVIGYTSFRNLTTKREEVVEKWRQRRMEAYLGSSMHFIRSLYQDKLEENSYELHSLRRVLEGEPGFVTGKKSKEAIILNSGTVVKDGENKKFVYLLDKKKLPADSIRKVQANKSYLVYPQGFQVIFKGEKEALKYALRVLKTATSGYQTSYLQAVNAIWLQPNGLWIENKDLLIYGYMKWERLSELLPVEYMPD